MAGQATSTPGHGRKDRGRAAHVAGKILPILAAGTSLAIGLTIVGMSLIAISESQILGPIRDFWKFIPMLEALDRGESLMPWLVKHHGGAHRLIIPKLFYLAEYLFFHGKNIFLISAGMAIHAMTIAILLRAMQSKGNGLLRRERVFAVGLILALTLSATQYPNFVRAWNIHWYLCITGMVAAIASLLRTHAGAQQGDPFRAWSWWMASIVFALVANYSMANGLLIWPALLMIGFVMRLAWRFMAGVTLVGIISIQLFQLGGNETGKLIDRFGDVVLWMLKCLGSPASWHNEMVGAAFAVFGILAGSALAVRLFRRRKQALPAECLLLAIMAISLGTIAMVAVGRLDYPWSLERYQTIVLLFWLSLSLLTLLAFRGSRSKQHPASIGIMLFSTLWLALLIFPSHFESISKMGHFLRKARMANTAILMGVQDRRAYLFVLPYSDRKRNQDIAELHRPFLEKKKLGVFAEGLDELLSRSMNDAYPEIREDGCQGAIQSPIVEGNHPQRMAIFRGRVRAKAGTELEDFLVLAEPDGTIVGLGRTLDRKFDFFGGSKEAALPFGGFTRVSSKSVDVFAITKSGRACPIARDVPIQERAG